MLKSFSEQPLSPLFNPSSQVSNANYKINFAKVKYKSEEHFGSYQDDPATLTIKLDSVKSKSVKELMRSRPSMMRLFPRSEPLRTLGSSIHSEV